MQLAHQPTTPAAVPIRPPIVPPAAAAAVRAAVQTFQIPVPTGPVLYVATCLRHFEPDPTERDILGRDLEQVDPDGKRRVYRRLDIPYYVWLFTMLKANKPRIPADQWPTVEARFMAVRAWAAQHLDRKALADALALGMRTAYAQPRPYDWSRLMPVPDFKPGISPECRAWCASITRTRKAGQRGKRSE